MRHNSRRFVPKMWAFWWISLIAVFSEAEEVDKWSLQLTELKMLVTSLDSKLSSLEGKLSGIQVLDYAFKVNKVDSSISSIDTRMNEMASQIDKIKDMLKTSCAVTRQVERIERTGNEPLVTSIDLMEKIENYGQKIITSQSELSKMAEKQEKELVYIKNISRSGFSKLYQRVDNVLTMEGQITRLSQSVRSLPPRLSQLTDQLNELLQVANDMKLEVQRNGEKLSNVTEKLSRVVSETKDASGNLSQQILRIADRLIIQWSELEENALKMKEVVEMGKQLQAEFGRNAEESVAENMKNLIQAMQALENSHLALMTSFSGSFDYLNSLLRGSNDAVFAEVKHTDHGATPKTTGKTTDDLLSINGSTRSLGDFPDRIYKVIAETNQEDIFNQLTFVSSALKSIRNDLINSCKAPLDSSKPYLKAFFG